MKTSSRALIWEVWTDEDDNPMLIPADGDWYWRPKLYTWLHKHTFVASFRAPSWKQAKAAYVAIMGWS